MINKTEYLQLKKPDGSEFYDIDVFNGNADSIDAELKKDSEELDKKLAKDGNSDSNIVSFQTASRRENIISGETHKTIFGKIKKFFADLKTVAFTGSYNDLIDLPNHIKSETITTAVDWNTLVSTGIYHIKTTEGTNRPTTNHGTLYVEGSTSTTFQIWIPDTLNSKIYKRYENSGWKNWQELTFIETSGETYDTGWKTLTYGYGTSAYNSGTVPKIRRIGKMVELRGVIKNSTSFTDHDSLLKNVPSDMRPSSPVYAVQTVGSQNAQLLIKTDGNIGIERYPGGNFPANVWISVCATWFVD